MKIIILFLITFFTISTFAQDSLVEKNFEKTKRSLSLVRYSEGEDASSGFDYLVYRKKTEVKKIRVIWSSSSNPPQVEDYYFENGKPVLFAKFSARKSQYNSLKKGNNIALKLLEKMRFEDEQLKTWIENGKNISTSDSRWVENEAQTVEAFKNQLEAFQMYLEELKNK